MSVLYVEDRTCEALTEAPTPNAPCPKPEIESETFPHKAIFAPPASSANSAFLTSGILSASVRGWGVSGPSSLRSSNRGLAGFRI